MSVTVRIPTTLRTLTGGESEVTVDPGDLGEVLKALDTAHPGFTDRLFDDEGGLRRFVNVFVADDDARFLQGLQTPVADGTARYTVKLTMEVEDRKGLLAAVSAKIADINTNIRNMEARTDEDKRARIDMTIEITDLKHLEKVIKAVRGVEGVLGVQRAGRAS